jgi:hypothetical protein
MLDLLDLLVILKDVCAGPRKQAAALPFGQM